MPGTSSATPTQTSEPSWGDAGPHGADVYWDTAGHQDLKAIAPLLAPGARIIVTAAHDPVIAFPARNYYTHDISVRPFAISNSAASDQATAARIINSRLADSTLWPRIGARMPLTAAAGAIGAVHRA